MSDEIQQETAPCVTPKQLAQIRQMIRLEDEARQSMAPHELTPLPRHSQHLRLLVAEIDRLRQLVNTKAS